MEGTPQSETLEMANTQKKQQTLSGFFTKAANQSGAPNRPHDPSTTKSRPIDSDDFELPEPKRVRKSFSPDAAEVSLPINARPLSAISPNAKSTSFRTSKYLFSSSPHQENEEQDTNGDVDRHIKEKLHAKFVKKLGKPDSIT